MDNKQQTMTNNKQQTPDKNYWLITINSWGTHLLYGTEEEAEDFRKHKCRWEQSIGTKRIANNEEILTYAFPIGTKPKKWKLWEGK